MCLFYSLESLNTEHIEKMEKLKTTLQEQYDSALEQVQSLKTQELKEAHSKEMVAIGDKYTADVEQLKQQIETTKVTNEKLQSELRSLKTQQENAKLEHEKIRIRLSRDIEIKR